MGCLESSTRDPSRGQSETHVGTFFPSVPTLREIFFSLPSHLTPGDTLSTSVCLCVFVRFVSVQPLEWSELTGYHYYFSFIPRSGRTTRPLKRTWIGCRFWCQ